MLNKNAKRINFVLGTKGRDLKIREYLKNKKQEGFTFTEILKRAVEADMSRTGSNGGCPSMASLLKQEENGDYYVWNTGIAP